MMFWSKKGVETMATSSIFTSFNIYDVKTAEAFADALDASSRDPERVRTTPESVKLKDKDAIVNFYKNRKKNTNAQ